VPAAIAAKIAEPKRTVVAFAGDGCFLMAGQELATAVQYNAAIIVRGRDNGMYGTIRMHQEKHYPGRVHGTDLRETRTSRLRALLRGGGGDRRGDRPVRAGFERCVATGNRR